MKTLCLRVPGVYAQEDAEALLTALQSGDNIPPYLVDTNESEKVIRFFTHVNWGGTSAITVPDGYMLDGQGFNLTLPAGVTLLGSYRDL